MYRKGQKRGLKRMKKLTPNQEKEQKFQGKIDKAIPDLKKIIKKHGY